MESEASLQERAAEAAAQVSRRQEGIALCLSGGGYRAALFHLGVLRRLHELKLFPQVRAISSVSGGSIMAAFLANALLEGGSTLGQGFVDWQRQVSDPFHRLTARDIRTWPFLLNLPWNWLFPTPRVRYLERLYRRLLTRRRLEELPAEFILCATDLVFGASWEFARDRTGDWRAGYVTDAGQWPLARAVAASSAFPPIFGPVRLKVPADGWRGGDYRGPDRDRHRRRMALSDGGVYDNMGLEPVWKDYATVLVSDGGAPFEFTVGGNPIRRLLRYTAVVTYQTRALRLRALFSDWNSKRYAGTYMSLTSGVVPPGLVGEPYLGYSQELAREVLGRIRTDLDCFEEAETAVLENHGYYAAERALRRYLPAVIPVGATEARPPYPEWVDEEKVRRALRSSHRRVVLGRLVRGVLQGP